MKKFTEGLKLRYSMLYGGMITATVTKVTDTEVTLTERWLAEDTLKIASADCTHKKHTDADGNEYIIVWEYRGHECKIYAEQA